MTELLYNLERKPAPRETFSYLEGNLQAGDYIEIPFIGQYPERFVPYGAAMGYAEGFLTLNITEAIDLYVSVERSTHDVLERFLGMNKDILTAAELGRIVDDVELPLSTRAIKVIFEMLKSKDRKTLFLVNGYDQFLAYESYGLDKHELLDHLSGFDKWSVDYKGASVSRNYFETHDNQDGMRISEISERNTDGKNKLEMWLDREFGEGHVVNLDPKSRKFIVTK
ncbi:hypothetical protein BGZ49_008715, partial [Haplosporangium sp. Z 27]